MTLTLFVLTSIMAVYAHVACVMQSTFCRGVLERTATPDIKLLLVAPSVKHFKGSPTIDTGNATVRTRLDALAWPLF